MNSHRISAQFTCLNALKVLLIVLITYTSCVQCNRPTQEEIDYAIDLIPSRFCGKKLNDAVKHYCSLRNVILNKMPIKKSGVSLPEFDFDTSETERTGESYDDEGHFKISLDDMHYSNDIPLEQGSRRRRRGIVEECCKRACYISELIRYCPQKG